MQVIRVRFNVLVSLLYDMTFQGWIKHLLQYELYVLLLLTFGAMVQQSVLIVVATVLLIFGVARFLTRQGVERTVVTPVDFPIIGLCLLLPISWWISIDRETTGWQIMRLLNGIGLFYAVIRWSAYDLSVLKLYKLVFACEAIGIIVIIMGLVSTKWPVGKSLVFDQTYQYLLNFSTQSIHPNVLGGTIILFLPIPLVLFWSSLFMRGAIITPRYSIGGLAWHGITTCLLLIGLLLTQSRGSILGFGATLCVLIFVFVGNRGRVVLLGSACLIGIIGLLFPQDFSTLLARLISDSAISTGAIRLEVWSRAYYMIQDFPFTGIGMGNFRTVLELMYPLFLTTEIIPHAHNLFLQIAADLGMIALICWFAIAIFVIFGLCTIIKYNARHIEQPDFLLRYLFATALLGSQTALLTHGFVDAVTWGGVRIAPFVWLLWGIAIALYLSHSATNKTA